MSSLVNKIFDVSGTIYRKAEDKWTRYERHISSFALIAGFVIDSLTLTRIDRLADHLYLISYLLVAGAGIVFVQFYSTGRFRDRLNADGRTARWLEYAYRFAPIVIQYAFGGLFSGFLVFYSRSASLAASWPFLLIVIALLIGNEFFRERYRRLTFQLTIFFTALYSYTIFSVPVVLKTISTATFLLSGTISIILIALFIKLIEYLAPTSVRECKRILVLSIAAVLIAINGLYFLNVIPPIPLSLKDAGVYHLVERSPDGTYTARAEDEPWYAALRPYEVYHMYNDSPVYVYSAVFAPSELKTDIVHEWQVFDEAEDRWREHHTVEFAITGGRDDGYRVFSLSNRPRPGWWRVNIKTIGGRIIGEIEFKIVEAGEDPPAIKTTRL